MENSNVPQLNEEINVFGEGEMVENHEIPQEVEVFSGGSNRPNSPRQKNYFSTRKVRQAWFLTALVIVPLINFAIFWVFVNFKTIILTFHRHNKITGEMDYIGFERYVSVFKDYVLGRDPKAQLVYINSLRAIVINLIILPIAFIASYSFYKKIRFEKGFRVLFMLPSIISLVVLTMVYRYMFDIDYGPLSRLFVKWNWKNKSSDWLSPYDSKHMWKLIYIFAIWAGLGTNVIMISGAMMRIPSDITEACLIDGVSFWREALQFVLPLVMPTIGIYFISILTSCLAFTMQPMLITGGTHADKYLTLGWYIYNVTNNPSSQDQLLQASTVGIVFSLLLAPLVLAARIIANKITPEVDF